MLAHLTRPRVLPVTIAVAVGMLWRLWLMGRYAGWEESDYGNLAMIQGVLDGGFLHYDMNHMPGYYALAALVHAVVGDAVIAGRAVSLLGGVTALGLAVALAVRHGGIRAGWVAAILLVIQPEFALYASSSLREPVAAAFFLGCLTALGRERLVTAGVCAAGAFFVRFDAALVLVPVLTLHALGTTDWRARLLRGLSPLLGAVLIWSIYCHLDHGTWAFWSHSVSVNMETGMGGEAEAPGQWWLNGAKVAAALLGWLMPWRIGWFLWLGLLVGVVSAARSSHGELRTSALLAVMMTGLWASIGFVGQHDPSHNLYWKWLCPIVPVVIPVAVIGAWRLADKLGRIAGGGAAMVLMVCGVVQAMASNIQETERQRERSEAWYRPQLELAQWIESEVPDDMVMVLDNIPACWIRRKPTSREMVSWFDVPVPAGQPDAFAEWIQTEDVGWVLWFREEWTQAPVIAPFLAVGGVWEDGNTKLVEHSREDGYGWILYEVSR